MRYRCGTLARLVGVAVLLLAGAADAQQPAPARPTLASPASAPAEAMAPVPVATTRHLPVLLNKSRGLQLPAGVQDIIVANPAIADVVVRTPNLAYVLGKQVGETNIVFVDSAGRQVGSVDLVVQVDLESLRTALRQAFPTEAVELVQANQAIALRGAVSTPTAAESIRQVARQFVAADGQIVNMLRVGSEQQVLVRVRVAEVSRSVSKQLGFNASFASRDAATGGGVALAAGRALASPFASVVGNIIFNSFDRLTLSLEALEQTGLVRTLAEPNLTAISGETASFLAGGEFPVPVPQDNNTVTIQFKQFGIRLTVTPVVLEPNLISLKIGTEVSALSDQGAVTLQNFRVSALTVRRAETTVELPSGGSIVIGGLLQNNINSLVEGIPALKDVPVLGALFRSTRFQRDETELLITVAPVLVRPVDSAALALPTDGFGPSNDVNLFLLQKLHAVYRGGRPPEGTVRGPVGFVLE